MHQVSVPVSCSDIITNIHPGQVLVDRYSWTEQKYYNRTAQHGGKKTIQSLHSSTEP